MSDFIIDVEKDVINAVISDPQAFYNSCGLRWYMFSSQTHQTIYKAIESCYKDGIIPDFNIIVNRISNDFGQDSDIYSKYLKNIVSRSSEFDFAEYCKIIINNYKKYKLLSLSIEFSEKLKAGADPDRISDSFLEDFIGVSSLGKDVKVNDFYSILKETWDEIVERSKSTKISGFTTGISVLDATTGGLFPGDLWIIAGRPGMGKSAMMCNMLLQQALSGTGVGLISLEMKNTSVARRLLSIYTGVSSDALRFGTLKGWDVDKVLKGIEEIKGLPIYMDFKYNHTFDSFVSTVRSMASNGAKVIYLDYLQLLAERDEDSTHELGRITRASKLLANEYNIAIVLGSQLNRNVESRQNKHPLLSDLRQSGNIEEDADVALGLYRRVVYDQKTQHPELLEIDIMKHRDGPVGRILAKFDESNYRIGDYEDDGKAKR